MEFSNATASLDVKVADRSTFKVEGQPAPEFTPAVLAGTKFGYVVLTGRLAIAVTMACSLIDNAVLGVRALVEVVAFCVLFGLLAAWPQAASVTAERTST
ncbi:hypothetical protein FEAC_20480 [Ferrimicrobium acidiphilum DSM 19497]|uniref:Uncharacterized protein n=1 Tax=Ferrimicrobium acidiphilum DSM 19497 TaxID=1121877 RepID=A0A0D8FSR7_9ACTN|nr:hypothetical protein FEAC_20480 [Ferrimicrobium acidiphilum DSM 19497]